MIDIRTLKDNKPIEARFVVLRKEKKQTREGKPYADLLLGNKTGSVPAKIWDSVDDVYGLFEKETVVGVTGRVQFWNERPQITVQAIKPVPEEEIDYEEFLPATPADVGGLKIKLANLIESIKNADLNRITSRILKDGAMAKRFETAPAAKGFHHAYLGGLLEHTVSVATLCDGIAGYYVGQVNRDLLVAGALLHDIGKTQEFSYRLAIDYSTEGRLIGHHVIGYEMVEKAAAEIGVSGEAALQLLHLILSHHGSHEFASPVLPQTIEALLLHLCDDADAKITAFKRIAEKTDEGSAWSAYDRVLGRFIYLHKIEDVMGEESPASGAGEVPF